MYSGGYYPTYSGGADTSLMVWDLAESATLGGASDTSDTDSEEEAAKRKDESYDSDVEAEKAIDYSSKMYSKPLRERREGTPAQAQSSGSSGGMKGKPLVNRTVSTPIPVIRSDFSLLSQTKDGPKPVQSVQSLSLEHVFGYRGFDCGDNVHFLDDEGAAFVFHAAGTGVVQDVKTGRQRFYVGHSDDILCLATAKGLVATGQIHPEAPSVHVWAAADPGAPARSRLRLPHDKGVNCLDFASGGRQLLSAGIDAAHTLCVWKWGDGSLVASGGGGEGKICAAKWRPDSDKLFVTAGIKSVKFWKVAGSSLVGVKGVSALPLPTMLCVGFGSEELTLTGAVSGDVWLWRAERLERRVEKAHGGPVFAMHCSLADGSILTGAKEKPSELGGGACVKLWDSEMKKSIDLPLPHSKAVPSSKAKSIVRALSRAQDRVIVGTKSCDIIILSVDNSAPPEFLLQAHGQGELWGLSAHPKRHQVATASYDGTLRIWDLLNKSMSAAASLGCGGVCVCWGPEGWVGVGTATGGVLVYGTRPSLAPRAARRDRSSPVQALKFSPSGVFLVAGYAEAVLDIYDATKGQLERLCYIKALSHPVLGLDFSADSAFLKATTSDYAAAVFSVPEGKAVSEEEAASLVYASWNDVVSPAVHGVWSASAESGEVNCADVAHASGVVATGDDAGLVKLFPFPCPERKQGEFVEYVGHSAHVTNVAFTFDDSYLVSTGGDDSCIFLWKTADQ